MEELLQKMMLKLESIDTKLEAVESRLGAVESRLDVMDTRLETVETKVDCIQLTLDSHHIENIESDNRLLEAIHSTNDRIDFTKGRHLHERATIDTNS